MKDYAEEFRQRLEVIDRDSKKILIINAGSMNHGKSSLFNSLLDRNAFAENDVRETVVSKDEPWIEDVYLIDTPGLNAEESDDVEAYAAYKRANMIVFVHTLKVGELKRNELNAINIIKNVLGEKYFWNHFCLAMTFLDAEKSDENINAIVDKTLNDIANTCGGKNFPVFLISNSRYKKGSSEQKQALIEKSGILQLRKYLKHNVSTWRNENNGIRKQRIANAKRELMSEIEDEHKRINNAIERKTKEIERRQQDFLYRLQSAVDSYRYAESEVDDKQSRLNYANRELKDLRNQHRRDRANY